LPRISGRKFKLRAILLNFFSRRVHFREKFENVEDIKYKKPFTQKTR